MSLKTEVISNTTNVWLKLSPLGGLVSNQPGISVIHQFSIRFLYFLQRLLERQCHYDVYSVLEHTNPRTVAVTFQTLPGHKFLYDTLFFNTCVTAIIHCIIKWYTVLQFCCWRRDVNIKVTLDSTGGPDDVGHHQKNPSRLRWAQLQYDFNLRLQSSAVLTRSNLS